MEKERTKRKEFIVEKNGEKMIKVSMSNIVYAILIVLVLLAGAGSILAYGTHSQIGEKIAGGISRAIPFPAAVVDWRHVVFLGNVEKNLASVQQFYKTQNFPDKERIDFKTDYGKKRLLIKEREIMDKLVEDQIIKVLAEQRGIKISQSDVDLAVTEKLKEYGTEDDVKNDLLKSYGWTMDDFKDRVVLPSMYTDALSKWVLAHNQDIEQPKNKIQQAQKDLQDGKEFSQVVAEYSQGASKQNGGELGWVKKEQVIPELANALFGANVPKSNSVIESSIGYHIVEIENKKKEGGIDVLQLRQIFVAKNTFTDWLQKQKQQMHVLVPMSGFDWNKSTGSVDFSDQQMREFEKEQRAKIKGDSSLLF